MRTDFLPPLSLERHSNCILRDPKRQDGKESKCCSLGTYLEEKVRGKEAENCTSAKDKRRWIPASPLKLSRRKGIKIHRGEQK